MVCYNLSISKNSLIGRSDSIRSIRDSSAIVFLSQESNYVKFLKVKQFEKVKIINAESLTLDSTH